ncbi:MAG: flagellar basal body rod protein FlgB [Betaproteobacteria bacterium]|nr:flagellar basal body rod protein FlgB [Betaproteobacteria bacterium]MBU6512139.1 flagellar basal body rod protein FlgB [Betaproteobacteria bacterium]MDE1954651.1 flagellar basal body rod protein FlgB [Betaproteobacteria bacterium]MDE2152426.1 flagellar basal body rod protein FlgB [Betaproteobacteria bacterium]MDE2479683.1 flagellar basal body rod protein FlgB [Betaproteobacteria bacterium]
MFPPSILDRAFAPLQDALDLRASRQQLLAANIVNADTPGYKAVDMDFAKALQGAVSGQSPDLALKTDQAGQLQPAGSGQPGAGFVGYQQGNTESLNGNTVDMNREQSEFAKNSIQYESDLSFLTQRIKTLNSAITG